LAIVGAVLACALGLGASTAIAQPAQPCASQAPVALTPTPDPLQGSNFQGGDGNQTDESGHIDWKGLFDQHRVVRQTDPNVPGPNDDDSFTQGSEECSPGGWTLTRSSVAGKDDILDVYRSFEHVPGHGAFLYLAFTRAMSNGTTFLTFELNQRAEPAGYSDGLPIPCRQNGDLLISFVQRGNQPADTYAYVSEWVTIGHDAGGCATTGDLQPVGGLDPRTDVQASFNGEPIDMLLPGQTTGPGGAVNDGRIDTGGFGEVAINLTRVLGIMGEPCSNGTFLSIWAHSRASASSDSAMKDYVRPEPFVVSACKAHPRLSSTTTSTVTLGTSILDTAILSRGTQPTGMITFQLYGPNDRRCSRSPIFTSTRDDVNGNGPYDSAPPFTPPRPGRYRWRVTYSGDANNHGAGPTRCGARSETVVVTRAQPEITTEASGTTVLPNPIHATATLTGSVRARGRIRFEVFPPTDTGCTGAPAHTSTVRVRGDDTYVSSDFTPTAVGTWRWIATYSGDRRNAGISTRCNDAGENVVVDPPTTPPKGKPAIATTATPSGPAGSPIMDTAHLTGGSDPTGTITFYVYGPDDSGCSGAPAAPPSTVMASGAGNYQSAPFTPTDPGTYRWVAHYSGDTNNDPAATSCNDSGEASVVAKATPAITTSASPTTVPNGGAVGDTAVLTGGADPRGTITFRLYGPNDATCSAPPVFDGSQAVIGNGSYPAPTPALTLAGTYRWVATYSGDGRNASAATHCGDPAETVVVEAPPPVVPTPDEPTPKPKPKPKPTPPHKPKPKPPPPPKPIVTG
jgi:hypothetical protein